MWPFGQNRFVGVEKPDTHCVFVIEYTPSLLGWITGERKHQWRAVLVDGRWHYYPSLRCVNFAPRECWLWDRRREIEARAKFGMTEE